MDISEENAIIGFDPNKSQISIDRLAEFIQTQITGDLSEVPGLGDFGIKKLKKENISTTFALMGKFLILKEKGVEPIEHCDRFFYWLTSVGITSHKHTITQAIAQKLDISFPGIYESNF